MVAVVRAGAMVRMHQFLADKCTKGGGQQHGREGQGVTIVLVSHGLDLVRESCQRALLLHEGQLVADGAPEEVVQRYTEMVSHMAEIAV